MGSFDAHRGFGRTEARYAHPLALKGARSRRRLVSFSPKLGRRVTFTSYAQRKVWIALEANPQVSTFCERPDHLKTDRETTIDFWVQMAGGTEQAFWILNSNAVSPLEDSQASLHGIPIRYLAEETLISWDVPIANWERIIPHIVAGRRHRNALLEQQIIVLLADFTSLERIKEVFGHHDQAAVLAGLFTLLANGKILSPELARHPLCAQTLFRRA
jgi:hypothetical protein